MGLGAVLLHGLAGLIAAGAAQAGETPPEKADESEQHCAHKPDKRGKKPPAECAADANTVDSLTIEGAARGKSESPLEPELVLDEEAMKAYGATSIPDLIRMLAPQLKGSGGDDAPQLTLINGQRPSGPQEMQLPLGAVLKTEILPEEAAVSYGVRPGNKVLNLVLKKDFKAVTLIDEIRAPVAGGRVALDQQVNLFRNVDKVRQTLDMRYQHETMLYEHERDIVPTANGGPYDLTGNVVGAGGGEIDPALSALVGSPVTVAAAPASAAAGRPALGDFRAGAGQAATDDLTTSRTLMPRLRSLKVDGAYRRNFGFVTTAFTGGIETSRRTSFLGLPTVSVSLPAGSPFSPFARDVTLYRAFDARDSMRQIRDSDKVEVGALALGMVDGWRWTWSGNIDRTKSDTHTGRGLDLTDFRAAVAAGDPTVNPFGPLPSNMSRYAREDTAESTTTNARTELNVNGTLAQLPTGKLSASFKGGLDTRRLESRSVRSGVATQRKLVRDRATLNGNIDVPVTSRAGPLAFLGDTLLNANATYEQFSDLGGLLTLGGGVTWTPVKGLSFNANVRLEDGEPTPDQVNAPVLQTPNYSQYDFATGQTVFVTRIDGGNPNLDVESRRLIKLGFNYKPFEKQDLRLNAAYSISRIDDQIAQLPSISPELEAAFPERFVRDSSGRLVSLDARAVNFAHADREELRWTLTYARNWGMPKPGAKGPPPPSKGPGNLRFSLTHTMKLRDEVLIREGMAPLDLLAGASIGRFGGTPRHEVFAQGNYYQSGVGGFAYAIWSSNTRVDGGPRGEDLRFSSIPRLGLGAYVDLSSRKALVKKYPALKGAWLNLSVDNIFGSYTHVRDEQGRTPLAYQKDYMDRQGRTIRLNLRKQL